jgi:Dolichyl-phosphate-mannose-protein mannosyltransferase
MLIAVQYRLALAALLASFCLFAASAWKPLQLDNMDFPAVAKQAAKTGLPIYYRGEPNPHDPGGHRTYGVPHGMDFALYHPPLYLYTLALWFDLLGFGEVQVRMFGYLCALFQGWIVLELVRALFGSETARRITGWFWLLFLLNPYTLQTASIADIDSTIYGPLLCGTLLIAVRMSWRQGEPRRDPVRPGEYVFLCAPLVLVLWAKLTTVWLLPPAILLLLVKRLGWAKACVVTAAVTISATVIFLATYFAYGRITGLDVRFTFSFTVDSLLKGSSGKPGLVARIDAFRNNFVIMAPTLAGWTGAAPWFAAIGVALAAAWKGVRDRDKPFLQGLVLVGLALITTAYYCGQTMTFGRAPFKYTFVYWGIVVACSALLLDFLLEAWAGGSKVSKRLLAMLAAAVYVVSALVSATWGKDTILLTGLAWPYLWLLYLPALVLLAVAPLRWVAPTLAVAALACAMSAWAGNSLGVAIYQARVNYSTTYDYGQTGFEDTVSFIRANTQPDEVIASMKDIGFKAERRYIENYGPLYGGPNDPARWLTEALSSGQVRYAVFTAQRGQDNLLANPPLKSWIEQNCALVRSFGDYRIYSYIADHERPQ